MRLSAGTGTIAIVLSLCPVAMMAQRPGEQIAPAMQHPDSALLVTDDLRNFTRALDVPKQGREVDTVAVLSREYFERATPGLRAYVARYQLTPQQVTAAMSPMFRFGGNMPSRLAARSSVLHLSLTD